MWIYIALSFFLIGGCGINSDDSHHARAERTRRNDSLSVVAYIQYVRMLEVDHSDPLSDIAGQEITDPAKLYRIRLNNSYYGSEEIRRLFFGNNSLFLGGGHEEYDSKWSIAHQVLTLLHQDNPTQIQYLSTLDTRGFVRSIAHYLRAAGTERDGSAPRTVISKGESHESATPHWNDTLNRLHALYGRLYPAALYSIPWFQPIATSVLGDCELADTYYYGDHCLDKATTAEIQNLNVRIAEMISRESTDDQMKLIEMIDHWCSIYIMFTAPYRFELVSDEDAVIPFVEDILHKLPRTRRMVDYMFHYLRCECISNIKQLDYNIPTSLVSSRREEQISFTRDYYRMIQKEMDARDSR